MKKVSTGILIFTLCCSVAAFGQDRKWKFVRVFPDTNISWNSGVHGLAVDPDGKIWASAYGTMETVGPTKVRAIYVFNPDGTQVPFSPIKAATIMGKTDTLLMSMRGIKRDADGNIVACFFDTYYRFNYKTGAAMAKVVADSGWSCVAPGFTGANDMVTGTVIPGNPVNLYDRAFELEGTVVEQSEGFSRTVEASRDGSNIYWPSYTSNKILIYNSTNGVLGPYALQDSMALGLQCESSVWHPRNGLLYCSSGSVDTVDYLPPLQQPWQVETWYGFDVTTKVAKDSITWNRAAYPYSYEAVALAPRPRAIDFSPGGDTAYVACFLSTKASIQMFRSVPDSGTLVVTVRNVENRTSPGARATVRLYGRNGQLAAIRQANDSSVASFARVKAGSGYSYTVEVSAPASPAPFDTLWWGRKTGLTVTAGDTLTDTFTRNVPYATSVAAFDNETNSDATGKSVLAGTLLRFEIRMKNPSSPGSAMQQVRARLALDTNRISPFEVLFTGMAKAMAPGDTATVSFYFAPQYPGHYYRDGALTVLVDSTNTYTESLAGYDLPFFTVTAPATDLVSLLYPARGEVLSTDSVRLLWRRDPAALMGYGVELFADSARLFFADSVATDTSCMVRGLVPGASYSWHVRARKLSGWGGFSAWGTFSRQLNLPGTVALVAPADFAVASSDSILLRWRSGFPAITRYWLELAVDSNFTFRFIDSTLTDSSFVSRNLRKGASYFWHVRAGNLAGWGPFSPVRRFSLSLTAIASRGPAAPSRFELRQNYPNPFNPSTAIPFSLPERCHVKLAVYNTLGEQVADLVDADMQPGFYEVRFDAAGLPSGVYFCRLRASSYLEIRKLAFVR